jgi:hypothetical protein
MSFFKRVKAIILAPKAEWPAIEQEPDDAGYLLTHYVAVLALIPVVAGFVGWVVIGVNMPLAGMVQMPVFAGLLNAILGYGLSFILLYAMAHIVNALAPTFGGVKNFQNALKLAAYASTPSWLAGIFLILPGLTFLTLLGLYGFYLLWLGLPVLMKSPPERTALYTLAIAVATILAAIVCSMLQIAIAAVLLQQ